jgi:hypothetical protein
MEILTPIPRPHRPQSSNCALGSEHPLQGWR